MEFGVNHTTVVLLDQWVMPCSDTRRIFERLSHWRCQSCYERRAVEACPVLFSESRSRSLFAVARPSVVCLSVVCRL